MIQHWKTHPHPTRGKKASEETRAKLRKHWATHPHPAWKGGRRICKTSGYAYLYKPEHPLAVNGYVAEHRFVMMKKIKRLLNRTEIVHHKNGIKSDNRPYNLQLFKNQTEHLKHH
jgi:hypothetical protein